MPVDYPRGNRLSDKVALVTGGARGMGESHARAMVAQGAKVVIGDVLDAEGEAVAKDLGDDAHFVHLDVTDRAQWAEAVATVVDRFGRLNVLVNNAAILNAGLIGDYPPEQWDEVIAVNLTGTFNGINASLEALKTAAPSSIVNISSTAGLQGYAALPGYTAAKFGVRGLTKAVALTVGPFGVRCNSIHPGSIDTPMTAGVVQSHQGAALKRQGRPQEISQLVVFLASDESSFSTGSEFVADGGVTSGLPADVSL
jgi:3alpha(or 20beta)-hydroxysteroid dehydrogenase